MALTDPENRFSLWPAKEESKCEIDWCPNVAHFMAHIQAPESAGQTEGPYCSRCLLYMLSELLSAVEKEWAMLDMIGIKRREQTSNGEEIVI